MTSTVSNAHYRQCLFPFRERVRWSLKVRRLGYYAVRQAMLRRGASLGDVAWVLVSTLMIQGAV